MKLSKYETKYATFWTLPHNTMSQLSCGYHCWKVSKSLVLLGWEKWYQTGRVRFFQIVVNHIWSNQVTTNSRPSTKIRKYFVSGKKLLKMYQIHLVKEKVAIFPEQNLWKQFLFPIFILRCWMIFHPLLKSESFTSSTIDHTFSMKRRDSAELVYFW